MDAVGPSAQQQWTPGLSFSSTSVTDPKPELMESRLWFVVSFCRESSMSLRGMVNSLVDAFVNDLDLFWWVSVSPSSIVQDICETHVPIWTAEYLYVSFFALRAAVSTIKGYGHEAALADSDHPSDYTVGAWKFIMYGVNESRQRLNDPD